MNILITGASGFIGKNLTAHLMAENMGTLFLYDRKTEPELLEQYVRDSDFIFHLAGVNRPKDVSDYEENYLFTNKVLKLLQKYQKQTPILFASSIQAQFDNPYGLSKKKAEEMIIEYKQKTGADIYIFRLPGVFGKWSKPDYNSVVSTFCYNISRDIPICITDPNKEITLAYIDDVLEAFTGLLFKKVGFNPGALNDRYEISPVYYITLRELSNLIRGFKESRKSLLLPDMSNAFIKNLYSTYLSYLPQNEFGYALDENIDNRGVFAECLKWKLGDQLSINITKPGMTKGGHWHHTKTEKFIAVSGSGIIRFQKLNSNDVLIYPVSSHRLEVVDIPPGYIHEVTNTGTTDLVLLIWANENFDPENPDTYAEKMSYTSQLIIQLEETEDV